MKKIEDSDSRADSLFHVISMLFHLIMSVAGVLALFTLIVLDWLYTTEELSNSTELILFGIMFVSMVYLIIFTWIIETTEMERRKHGKKKLELY